MSRRILLAFVTFCGFTACANAATHRWVSPHGDMSFGSSWSTGQVPSTWSPNDDVVFDSGTRDAINGLNQIDVKVRRIIITDGYSGDIGLPGNPLRISARQVTHSGGGQLILDTTGATLLTSIVIDSSNVINAARLFGPYYYVVTKHGRTFLSTGATAHTLITTYSTNTFFVYTILEGTDTPSPRNMFIGTGAVNYRMLDNSTIVNHSGGDFYQFGQIGDGATIYQSGGTLYYDPPTDDGIARPRLMSNNGALDFSSCYQTIEASGFLAGQAYFDGTPTQATPESMGLVDFYPDTPNLLALSQGDADADGVPDLLDACNATPVGASVNQHGTLAGDVNGDCKVDLLDAAIMQNEFTGP